MALEQFFVRRVSEKKKTFSSQGPDFVTINLIYQILYFIIICRTKWPIVSIVMVRRHLRKLSAKMSKRMENKVNRYKKKEP